jgi:hypothetical protein
MESLSEQERTAILQHWSLYGQRGATPSHRVMPDEWKHLPFLKPETTSWHVPIAPDQLPLLLLGFKPRMSNTSGNGGFLELFANGIVGPGDTINWHIYQSVSLNPDMPALEDKWFIYSEGPDHAQEVRLHMHRSWTGKKMIELRIDSGFDGHGSDGKGARITSITWETDPQTTWRGARAETAKEVAREVCSWVLDVELGPEEGSPSGMQSDKIRPTEGAIDAIMSGINVSTTVYRRT